MTKNTVLAILGVLMVATMVSADLLFFRHHITRRLFVNAGVILVFIFPYLTYLRRQDH